MKKRSIEERVSRNSHHAIKVDGEGIAVNWKYLERLKKRDAGCCLKAREIIVDKLIQYNVLTRDKEKGICPFVFYDQSVQVFEGIYFTDHQYAQEYAKHLYGKDLFGIRYAKPS